MARRSTIEKLPEDVRRWLERALTESGFSGYNELEVRHQQIRYPSLWTED